MFVCNACSSCSVPEDRISRIRRQVINRLVNNSCSCATQAAHSVRHKPEEAIQTNSTNAAVAPGGAVGLLAAPEPHRSTDSACRVALSWTKLFAPRVRRAAWPFQKSFCNDFCDRLSTTYPHFAYCKRQTPSPNARGPKPRGHRPLTHLFPPRLSRGGLAKQCGRGAASNARTPSHPGERSTQRSLLWRGQTRLLHRAPSNCQVRKPPTQTPPSHRCCTHRLQVKNLPNPKAPSAEAAIHKRATRARSPPGHRCAGRLKGWSTHHRDTKEIKEGEGAVTEHTKGERRGVRAARTALGGGVCASSPH